MGSLWAVYWIPSEANRSGTFIESLEHSWCFINGRYFHWYLWFILLSLFSPAFVIPVLSLMAISHFPELVLFLPNATFLHLIAWQHNLGVWNYSADLTADSDKMCFSCPRSSIPCLAEAFRSYEANILLLSICREPIFGQRTLLHSAHSTNWATGDLLFAHPITHLWASTWIVL